MPVAIYDPERNCVRTFVRDDRTVTPPSGCEARDPATLPSDARYEPEQRFTVAEKIQTIKEQARADILARFPEWKQANMTARAVDLLERKTDQQLTDAERTEIDAIRAAWQWIKDRRAQSDAEEAALLAARVDALIDPA